MQIDGHYAGSGVADMDQVHAIKSQLLGFLLYGTAASVRRILESFGTEEDGSLTTDLNALLPGPHPILRCLISISAGNTPKTYATVSVSLLLD